MLVDLGELVVRQRHVLQRSDVVLELLHAARPDHPYYDWSRIDPVWKEREIFPILSDANLRATLGILARTVAPGMPRPIRTA
jgi:hypothetical protein